MADARTPVVPKHVCPNCNTHFAASNPPPPEFPFCSPRCKMVDLGRWFTGQYSISRPLTDEDAPGGSDALPNSPADMMRE